MIFEINIKEFLEEKIEIANRNINKSGKLKVYCILIEWELALNLKRLLKPGCKKLRLSKSKKKTCHDAR